MNQYVTTYRKDYLWPYAQSFPITSENEILIGSAPSRIPANCHCNVMDPDIGAGGSGDSSGSSKEQHWNRLGPMGPLLDAKLHPAKVGPSPETETSRYNQPNAFLQRLHETYPVLYDVLQSAPEAELLSRVNAQRMYTTYQIDFCGRTEYPPGKFEALIGAQGANGLGPCPATTKLPDDPCRPNQRPIAFVQHTLSPTAAGKSSKTAESSVAGSKPSPRISEYMDSISKMGQIIMKQKLHQSSKFEECS